VVFYGSRAVELQVRERPFLVEHTDGCFSCSSDGLGFGALGHRRDQQVVAVHDVVDDGHRRRPLLALEAEDAGSMALDERTSLSLVHHSSRVTRSLRPTATSAGKSRLPADSCPLRWSRSGPRPDHLTPRDPWRTRWRSSRSTAAWAPALRGVLDVL